MAMAVFACVQVISFNAPLMRIIVDPPATAPLLKAATVTAFASLGGAA
jgi:hypothetical protein